MTRTVKFSIRYKLFFLILAILAANLLLIGVLGSSSFEEFYSQDKQKELKNGAISLKGAYGTDGIYDALYQVESQNITVAIFHQEQAGLYTPIVVEYYSRFGSLENGFRESMTQKLQTFYTQRLYENLQQPEIGYVVLDEGNMATSYTLFAQLDGDSYVMLETPRKYIAETANLAIEYTMILSALVFLAGGVLVYFTAARIARPIQQIQEVADQLAGLNFARRCQVGSRDEVGLLAESINYMADRLEENTKELVAANQQLQDDLYRQEQSDQLRKTFIANVSHDFKTPLSLITSYAEALRDLPELSPQTREEYCNIIMDEGYKLSRMVQQLLELSRLESGKQKLELTEFSIGEMIRDAAGKVGILLKAKEQRCVLELDDTLAVQADYQKIDRVVANLLDNSMKYGDQGGDIVIRAFRQNDRCRVEFFNNAPPIDSEKMKNLFLSFYRADGSRTFDTQSYGLGLAIVRATMELHGMGYGVYNAPNGVVFWFELPLAQEMGEELEESSEEES